MHMCAKSIFEFWIPIEKGVQTPYFLVRNETERIPLRLTRSFIGTWHEISEGVDCRDSHYGRRVRDGPTESQCTWRATAGERTRCVCKFVPLTSRNIEPTLSHFVQSQ